MSLEAYIYAEKIRFPRPCDSGMYHHVLATLAEHADENHVATLSFRHMSADNSLYEWANREAVTYLQDSGILTVRIRHAGHSPLANSYVLHGPWDNYGGTGVPFLEQKTVTPWRGEGARSANHMKVIYKNLENWCNWDESKNRPSKKYMQYLREHEGG